MQEKKYYFIMISLTTVFCFFMGEVFIRVLKPQKTYSNLLTLLGEQYRESRYIPFTLKANYKAKMPSMEYPGKLVSVSTNSLGLRGKEVSYKKPIGTKRVLILGDSYAFGVYVNDDETYSAVLEKLYGNEGKKVEVINAGYADGWSPDEEYTWLINEGLKFQPDIIIYCFFIGNDIDELYDTRWKEIDRRGLPKKIIDNSIYIDSWGRIRSRSKDGKTVGIETIYKIPILRESHLAIFLYNTILNTINNLYPAGKTVNKGWSIDPFPFILQAKSNSDMIQKENLFMRLIKGMKEVSDENNSKFIVLMIPINFQVDKSLMLKVLGSDKFSVKRNYFEELKPSLQKSYIQYLDLLEKMSKDGGKFYPLNGEVHFNPNGHLFTAKTLKANIDALDWLNIHN